MTVADLVEPLKDVNPAAPICLDFCGFVFDVAPRGAQNGRVYIQG